MPSRIDELYFEIRLRQEQLKGDIKRAASLANDEVEEVGKESGRKFGVGFRVALAAAIGTALLVIRRFAIDSVKEFARSQTGTNRLTDAADKMALAWRRVKARVGEMIVSMFRLGEGTEAATGIFEKLDGFLVEHRRGIIKLANVFIGLGQIVHNTFKAVADAIVITFSGATRAVLQVANLAIRALNFVVNAADKIPGVNLDPIPLFDLSRSEELLDQAGQNILDSFQGIADGARRIFSDEVPEALQFTVKSLDDVDKKAEEVAETLKGLDIPVGQGGDLAARVKILADALARLGLTVDDLAKKANTTQGGLFDALFGDLELDLQRESVDWLSDLHDLLDQYDEDTKDASDSTRDLVRDITDGARAALDLAQAFGVLDSNAASAINSLINVGSAIERIATGDIAGGIAQGVSGLAGFISGVFGASPADMARKENTIALGRLRESVDKLANLFANQTGAATDRLLNLGQAGIRTGSNISPFRTIRDLENEMARLGVTITELETFAQAAGIPVDKLVEILRTGEGDISEAAAQFEGVNRALMEAAEAAETFNQALDRLRLEFELFDIDDPAEQFRRVLDRAGPELGKLGQALLGGLGSADLSTPEGVAAARDALRQAFDFLNDPNVARGALFGGLTEAEFENLLREGNALLESIEQDLGVAVGAPGTGSAGFQVFKGVTEITGNRIAGLLTTIAYWTEQTARGVHGEGANLPPPNTGLFGPFQQGSDTLPPAPTAADVGNATGTTGGGGLTVYYSPSIGGVRLAGSGTGGSITRADVDVAVGSALARAEDTLVRRLDRKLGQRSTRTRRATHGKLD